MPPDKANFAYEGSVHRKKTADPTTSALKAEREANMCTNTETYAGILEFLGVILLPYATMSTNAERKLIFRC